MEHQVECLICLCPFDGQTKIPLLNPDCGHTCCKQCLLQLPVPKRCPVDRVPLPPVESLPTNFALLAVADAQARSGQRKPAVRDGTSHSNSSLSPENLRVSDVVHRDEGVAIVLGGTLLNRQVIVWVASVSALKLPSEELLAVLNSVVMACEDCRHTTKAYGAVKWRDKICYVAKQYNCNLDLIIRSGPQLEFSDVCKYFIDLLKALAELHDAGLVAGGVCPQSISVSEFGDLLLDDPGVSCTLHKSTGVGVSKVPLFRKVYWSPEQIAGGPSCASTKGDIWSLAWVCVYMLTQQQPSAPRGEVASMADIWYPPIPDNLPSQFTELLHECMAPEPADRPDACLMLQRVLEVQPRAPSLRSSMSASLPQTSSRQSSSAAFDNLQQQASATVSDSIPAVASHGTTAFHGDAPATSQASSVTSRSTSFTSATGSGSTTPATGTSLSNASNTGVGGGNTANTAALGSHASGLDIHDLGTANPPGGHAGNGSSNAAAGAEQATSAAGGSAGGVTAEGPISIVTHQLSTSGPLPLPDGLFDEVSGRPGGAGTGPSGYTNGNTAGNSNGMTGNPFAVPDGMFSGAAGVVSVASGYTQGQHTSPGGNVTDPETGSATGSSGTGGNATSPVGNGVTTTTLGGPHTSPRGDAPSGLETTNTAAVSTPEGTNQRLSTALPAAYGVASSPQSTNRNSTTMNPAANATASSPEGTNRNPTATAGASSAVESSPIGAVWAHAMERSPRRNSVSSGSSPSRTSRSPIDRPPSRSSIDRNSSGSTTPRGLDQSASMNGAGASASTRAANGSSANGTSMRPSGPSAAAAATSSGTAAVQPAAMDLSSVEAVGLVAMLTDADEAVAQAAHAVLKRRAASATPSDNPAMSWQEAVPHLLQVLGSPQQTSSAQRHAAELLVSMLQLRSNGPSIVADWGGAGVLVKVLKQTSLPISVLRPSLAALAELARGNEAVRSALGQPGCLEVLLPMLGYDPREPRLQASAVSAVRALASVPSNQERMANAGVVPMLVPLLRQPVEDVLAPAASALRYLSSSELGRQQLISSGAAGPLAALLAWPDKGGIVEDAAMTLQLLAASPSLETKGALLRAGAVVALSNCLQGAGAELTAVCLTALALMSYVDGVKAEALLCQAPLAAVTASRRHMQDPSVLEPALLLLRNCAGHTSEALEAVLQAGAMELVLNLMQASQTQSDDVLTRALSLLQVLVLNPHARSVLVAAGGIDVLRPLKRHPNGDIAHRARVVRNYMKEADGGCSIM